MNKDEFETTPVFCLLYIQDGETMIQFGAEKLLHELQKLLHEGNKNDDVVLTRVVEGPAYLFKTV